MWRRGFLLGSRVRKVDLGGDAASEPTGVLEEGLHAVCEVDGTDAGGGDGLWYATVQPGLVRIPGDGTTYLFSQLPS